MYRVLIIESSETKRFALSKAVIEAGCEPVGCVDYWQAVKKLRSAAPNEFNAVVLGWQDYEEELLELLREALDEAPCVALPLLIMADHEADALAAWVASRPSTHWLQNTEFNHLVQQFNELSRAWRDSDLALERHVERDSSVKILLVDESPQDIERYEPLLLDAGYIVDSTDKPDIARQLVRSGGYDIAIVDYFILESAPGLQLAESLLASGNLRLISLISAYIDNAVQHSLELGASECVFKTGSDVLFVGRINALANQVEAQKHAEAERSRFEAILSSVGEGVFGVEIDGSITFMNPAGERMLGFEQADDYTDKSAQSLIHVPQRLRRNELSVPDLLAEAYATGAELTQYETIFRRCDGQKLTVVCTVAPLEVQGQRQGSVVAFRDITERKQLERRLLWQATRDPLTDLFNRRYFEQALSKEVIKINHQEGLTSALLYIDFDQFKYLNDTAGHDAGDELLVEASQRLKECVRNSDDVARLGGDEFAVILRSVGSEDAFQISEHLRDKLQEVAYMSEEVSFKLSCSIGVAMIESGLSDKEVLGNADIACHIAKRQGRNQSHLYSQSTDLDRAAMSEEIAWSTRLKQALETEDFVLMYQPILPLDQIEFDALPGEPNRLWASLSHFPDHYEVLLRMRGDNSEMISPGAFLPLAERFNLIQFIDLWVIRQSVKQLEELRLMGRPTSFSVNLSGCTLNAPDVLSEIEDLLKNTALDPSSLVFEVTETTAIERLDVARNFIDGLRKRGWRFALDDFGTGFRSFSQLKHLPVDIVKIDGSFVQDMSIDPIDRAIVVAINDIAQSLGMNTIAEYVETRETLELLREYGVNQAQGYYISKPLHAIATRASTEQQMLLLSEQHSSTR